MEEEKLLNLIQFAKGKKICCFCGFALVSKWLQGEKKCWIFKSFINLNFSKQFC